MDVPFYDNYEPEPSADGWLGVERIYLSDRDRFDDLLYGRVHEVFASLPEPKGPDRDGCYWWYMGHEGAGHGYLAAGVEPPDLQVFGTLRGGLRGGDREFRHAARGLPVRPLRNG
jgi:hypothetical protein